MTSPGWCGAPARRGLAGWKARSQRDTRAGPVRIAVRAAGVNPSDWKKRQAAAAAGGHAQRVSR